MECSQSSVTRSFRSLRNPSGVLKLKTSGACDDAPMRPPCQGPRANNDVIMCSYWDGFESSATRHPRQINVIDH